MDFEESKIKWKSNLFYTFVLTNRCNYRCKHCLVEDYSGDIDFDLVVNNIKELHKIGVETISFTGGEVFLYEKWYEVFKLCNDLGINVSFVTNGSQFNEKSIDWLKKIRPGICFSLDGPEKFHNDYRGSDKAFMNVVKSIELVQACELPVTIYYTCYKQNLKYVDWIIDFCIDHNVKRLRIQPIEYVGNAKKNIKESDLLDDQDKIELLKKCIDSNGKNIGI